MKQSIHSYSYIYNTYIYTIHINTILYIPYTKYTQHYITTTVRTILTIRPQQRQRLIRHTGELQVALALLVAARQVDAGIRDAIRHADVPGAALALVVVVRGGGSGEGMYVR